MRNNTITLKCSGSLLISCILFILLCPGSINASEDIRCEMVKSITLKRNSLYNSLQCSFNLPFAYYYCNEDWDPKERTLKVLRVNIETESHDSLLIRIPSKIKINYLPSLSFSGDFLILADDEYFSLYKFKKINNNYSYQNKIELPPRAGGKTIIALSQNKFLLTSIYNFHPKSKKNNTNIGVYDAEKNIVSKFIHPDLPCIGYSHFPNHWVDASDSLIAVADPCGYKITFYDHQLNAVDSIDYAGDETWHNLPGNKIPSETDPSKIHPKILIDKILLLDDTVSRIEKIFFMQDNLLVSSKCRGGKEKRRIDIWNLSDHTKPLISQNALSVNYNDGDSIILPGSPLTIGNSNPSFMSENILYTLSNEEFIPEKNSSVSDFNNLKNIYYEDHDPYYSIQVRRIIIP